MMFVVITLSFVATLVILGLCYLIYEIITDKKKPTKKVEDIPQPTNLRFKKPKL